MSEERERFREIARESALWALKRTVAFYTQQPGGNPVMHGSGVLLQVADVGFVLSASHVLSAAQDASGRMLVGAPIVGSRLIGLHNEQFAFSRDTRDVDVGVVRLSENSKVELSKHNEFLNLAELDLGAEMPQGQYLVAGYPQQLACRDDQAKVVINNSLWYGTHLVAYEQTKPGVSLVVAFTSDSAEWQGGGAVGMPHLQGISGCGMWRAWTNERHKLLDRWNTDWTRLAGIEHSYVRGQIIKGTLVRHAVAIIGRTFADLTPSIRLSMEL